MTEHKHLAELAGDGTATSSVQLAKSAHAEQNTDYAEAPINDQDNCKGGNLEAEGDDQPEAALDSADENEGVSVKEGIYTEDGTMIANFSLFIVMILNQMDCGKLIKQVYKMMVCLKGKEYSFDLSAADFSAGNFMPAIDRVAPNAILHRSSKELLIAVKKTITEETPIKEVSLRTGFTTDYKEFHLPGMRITPEGITSQDEQVVDSSGGNLIRNVNFLRLEADKIKFLLIHLIFTFTSLKSKKVMFLVLGHVALAPFASWIVNEMGRQKYALHLEGPSGGGKTFLARLVGSFFGTFGEQLTSWFSTANSIEAEGFFFRDMIYILDDLKTSVVSQKEIIRVIQNHADNRGRSRLNSSLQLLQPPHISGLLLSTGENFVENVESVSARTIVLEVESEIDEVVGEECREMQDQYKGFIPMFVEWMISKLTWQEEFKRRVNERIKEFSGLVTGVPNGYRMATNLSLNAVAFEFFGEFAVHVNAIDDTCYKQLMAEYDDIVGEHLKAHVANLKAQDPADQCLGILVPLIITGAVVIEGLASYCPGVPEISSAASRGKLIGKVSRDGASIYIWSDFLMDHLKRYFRRMGQSISFDKNTLRDALVKKGLMKLHNGRYAKPVRMRNSNKKPQAWRFDLAEFKKLCSFDVEDE